MVGGFEKGMGGVSSLLLPVGLTLLVWLDALLVTRGCIMFPKVASSASTETNGLRSDELAATVVELCSMVSHMGCVHTTLESDIGPALKEAPESSVCILFGLVSQHSPNLTDCTKHRLTFPTFLDYLLLLFFFIEESIGTGIVEGE